MAHTNEITIQSIENISSFKGTLIPRISLLSASLGLWLQDDSTPTSGAMGTEAGFVDADIETAIVKDYTDNWSIGIDLGSAKTIERITLYDDGTNTIQALLWGQINNALELYTSPDNSTWTLMQTFDHLTREIFIDTDEYPSPPPSPLPSPLPFSNRSEPVYNIDLVPDDPFSSRYIKLHAYRGGLADVAGDPLEISEIEAWTQPDVSAVQKQNIKEAIVVSDVTATPTVGPGDGTNEEEVLIIRTNKG